MKCTVCKREKDEDAFHQKRRGRRTCKECRKIYDRKYYYGNKDRILKRNREYQQSGGSTHYFACILLNSAKTRSLKKQRLCTLMPEDILDLRKRQSNKCVYLGTKMVWRPKAGILQVSLDRINSSQGYVLQNCQLVCEGINRLKSDMKEENFTRLLKILAHYPIPDNLPPLVPYSDFTPTQKCKFSDLYSEMGRGRRKITRNITREDLHHLRDKYQDRCALTGIRVTWEPNQLSTASWDRIDSRGDYEVNNVQLTLWCVNRMKGSHSNEDAMDMINLIRETYG